jgi:hypothetical protein
MSGAIPLGPLPVGLSLKRGDPGPILDCGPTYPGVPVGPLVLRLPSCLISEKGLLAERRSPTRLRR